MNPAFSPALLTRIEDAGINASAPREQRWVDGWLVRFSPGKAKRARCVQAVAAGRLPLDDRLERCFAVYADAGLRPYFRITPFSQPAGLDEQLKAHVGDRVFDTVIPRNVRLAEAPSYGMPGLVFDPASKGALAFLDFAREMAARVDARSVPA